MSSHGRPERPPAGYRPLKDVARESELTYRQLWRRAQDGKIKAETEDGEINAALQTASGRWYLHPTAKIEREKKRITPELVSKVERALKRGVPPRTIAYKEGISDTKVYAIRDDYHEKLRKKEQEREEALEVLRDHNATASERRTAQTKLQGTLEVASLHGRPGQSYVIHLLDEAQEKDYADRLKELPEGRFYFDRTGGLVLLVGAEHIASLRDPGFPDA